MAEESYEEPEFEKNDEKHENNENNEKVENYEEHDIGGMPEDSQPPQKEGSDIDLGEGKEKKWPGWPGENVFRMLVPVQKVGGIIGRKGELIKKITEETKARIKILDCPPGTLERAVMVSAREEPDAPISPAMDGLLRVHKRIVDVDSDDALDSSGVGRMVVTRLLVADTQAGILIGKQGGTIKSIQDVSGCTIRILGEEHLPRFALQGDSVVEIQGDTAGVHKSVELIASHLRKFLVDHSVLHLFETQMQMPNAQAHQNMPPHQSWGAPPEYFPMNAGDGPGFVPNRSYMQPPREFDNYYPPADMEPMNKTAPRPPVYGRDASIGFQPSSVQPHQPMLPKVTQHMQIHMCYADAVIGASGANISYIRRASGATIAIQESRGVPGEMTVEIIGSASQIQTAQQLLQNSLAEAASSTQNPAGGSVSQGYSSYQAHGPVYAPPTSNNTNQAGYAPPAGYSPSGDYSLVYDSNYNY